MFQIFFRKFFIHDKCLPDTKVNTLSNVRIAHLDSLPCIIEIIKPLDSSMFTFVAKSNNITVANEFRMKLIKRRIAYATPSMID